MQRPQTNNLTSKPWCLTVKTYASATLQRWCRYLLASYMVSIS